MDTKHVVLGFIVFTLVFVGYILYSRTVPIVEISHTTGECVKVIDHKDRFSCDNMPRRYERVWVK